MTFLAPLTSLLSPLARRFVAGEKAEQAVAVVRKMNGLGIDGIIDFLGEDVSSEQGAANAASEYIRLLQMIHRENVRSAVSLKMSQMGILISKEVCLANLRRVMDEAQKAGLFVWIDMEGSALTQKTIDVFDALRRQYPAIGLCLQAYLVRTGGDFDHLSREPFNLRLCKGAYKEPASIAYTSRSAVNGNYRMLAEKIFEAAKRNVYGAFGTHDGELVNHIVQLASQKGVPKDRFEFQMLYGIQGQKLAELAGQGFRANVYIPYGTHWLPYFIRRLRERKENVYFLMRNAFRV